MRWFVALTLAFGVMPVCARADAPLRTVVYHYSVDEHGFTGAPSASIYGAVSENGSSGLGGSTGTVRVDVMSATSDGGLVVDITQSIDRDLRPLQTLRCAVYGRTEDVVCDQNLATTEAENILLMYFGRYFYEASRVDAGGHWQTSPHFHDSQMAIVNDFTVSKADGNVLTIKVDRVEKGGGYYSKTQGTLVYDTARSVPDSIELATTIQRSGDQGDMDAKLKLLSDSMAPVGGQNSH